jgi:PAS domain S-box-containing protein
MMKTPTAEQLLAENAELRARLGEAEQTLDAIRCGDVDAVVVSGPKGEQIFSLVGAESIYRLIVETMNEAAFTVAFDGTILFCNSQFGQFVQRPMEQIVGHRLHEFVAPDNVASADSLLILSRKQPVKQRLVLWNSQEQRVPVHISANTLNQPNGPSICIVASDLTELENSTDLIQQLRRQQEALRDSRIAALNLMKDAVETRQQTEQANEKLCQEITERKKAEEALREAEREKSLILDNANEIIAFHDTDNNLIWANKAYLDATGLPLSELKGRKCYCCWRLDRRCEHCPVVTAIQTGEPQESELTPENQSHWPVEQGSWLVKAAPVRDSSGNIVGAIEVAHDITERKRAEAALRDLTATLESEVVQRTAQLQQRARQLQKLTLEVAQTEDRERKRMAEILHDDLQQIIAGAKFHLSLMRNRVKHDAALEVMASKIDDMLRDAIEKSRGLSHELSPVVLHHGDFIETLGWLAGQMQAKHGLVVHVHAKGQVHLRSEAIKTFLYKTAQELLFNVVKHARVHEAGLRLRRRGPYVCLSVSDRGRGFDPQGLREAVGYGLLSIRERIELLGGRVKIKSAKGEGSTIFIVVPDGQAHEVSPEIETRSGDPAMGAGRSAKEERGRLRVLLADDHKIVREGLRSLLSDEPDIEIVGEAAHGREAVDLALRLKPDVVIMDVSMPLIDGDIATQRIRSHLPKTRVIALSTYNEPETIEKMYKAGAEGYVLKTASSEELLAAIRGHRQKCRCSGHANLL